MKRLLTIALLALAFSSAAPAQKQTHKRPGVPVADLDDYTPPAEANLEQLIDARAKLIQWYVLSSSSYAWGVSVCGSENYLSGAQPSWLTVYVYRDSLAAFAKDFDKAATRTKNGTLTVDGISVVVVVIERPKNKGAINEQPKSDPGKPQDRGGNV